MSRHPDSQSDELIRLIDAWRRRKIVLVGDFMLDHHVYGNADRLSPDAPVPVLAAHHEHYQPGGAANVAFDLRALGCDVACLGVVGRDESAERLRAALRDRGCSISGLIASTDRPTSIKHNFVGLAQHRHPQKMFRVDQESLAPIPDNVSRRLLSHADKLLERAELLCLQDQNKGVLTGPVCQQLFRLSRRHKVPVLVDPAATDQVRKYRGATCITPNRFEAALAVGQHEAMHKQADFRATARQLLRELRLSAIVVTLDRHGALLMEKGKAPLHLPTEAREVYDVTGAGDMVLAMLAAAISNGADWPQAVHLANIAAGLEVQKFGTVPVELDEVLLTLLQQRHKQLGKVRTLEQLLPELSAYRKQGRKIAFTNGCFDLLHAGHVSYLREAGRHGDLLVVAVNSDSSVRRIKGNDRPVNQLADRLMVLSELESIDYLIVFDQDTPMHLIRAIRPQVLVKGGDYRRRDVVGGAWVERRGGRVVLVNLVKGRSTTSIIRRIGKGMGIGQREVSTE